MSSAQFNLLHTKKFIWKYRTLNKLMSVEWLMKPIFRNDECQVKLALRNLMSPEIDSILLDA